MKKRMSQISMVVIPLLVVAVCGYFLASGGQFFPVNTSVPSQSLHIPVNQKMPIEDVFQSSAWHNGVAIPSMPDLSRWMIKTGEAPGIVQTYIGFDKAFPAGTARAIASAGALPLIQINPWHTDMRELAQGYYDRHLLQWNAAIVKAGVPVALSFGHEMNGPWFPWGCGHVSRGDFISAWRHMHRLMTSHLIRWVYTANRTNHLLACGPLEDYPGSAYVTWVGIDGYLRHPTDTFSTVFGDTLRIVHRVAPGKPILLTEAGVPSSLNQALGISNLYAGAHNTTGMIGIVYFDNKTAKGNYRPQDNPAALRAFRKAIAAK